MTELEKLQAQLRACRHCEGMLEPRPVVHGNPGAPILQVSQAPGKKVHETGIPFNDASGRRLRQDWYQISDAQFYDPDLFYITSMGHCYQKKEKTERRLAAWADRHGKNLVAGHTHRPSFPLPGEGRYFNDGSCVHPRSITALELECGEVSLVKWSVKVREDNLLYIGREVLGGPEELARYV